MKEQNKPQTCRDPPFLGGRRPAGRSQAQPQPRGQGCRLERSKSMPGPRQWGTQPRSVTRPQEALPLRPQGLSREQGESSAAGWLESGTRGLRGWGRPPRPPAPDPSLASGCPYRRLGAWAASPRKPLEDAPHNPGSREIDPASHPLPVGLQPREGRGPGGLHTALALGRAPLGRFCAAAGF